MPKTRSVWPTLRVKIARQKCLRINCVLAATADTKKTTFVLRNLPNEPWNTSTSKMKQSVPYEVPVIKPRGHRNQIQFTQMQECLQFVIRSNLYPSCKFIENLQSK